MSVYKNLLVIHERGMYRANLYGLELACKTWPQLRHAIDRLI